MNHSEEILVSIGLTPTEAKIYIAGLSTDAATIQAIVRMTRIKRPTVYHAIATLLEKGLVSERKVGAKSHFSMTTPEHIRALVASQKATIEKNTQKLDDLIPILLQQKKPANDDATVIQYSGIEGMKMVMDIAFYCKSKKWDIIAPYHNFLREYDAEYIQRYLRARKHYGITSRTLWERGPSGTRTLTDEERRDRNPRLMPKVMHGKFRSMIILFDNKVALFSSYEKLSAILITSTELSAMMRALFEGIWNTAEDY